MQVKYTVQNRAGFRFEMVVRDAEGRPVEFPEGITDEEIKAAVRQDAAGMLSDMRLEVGRPGGLLAFTNR